MPRAKRSASNRLWSACPISKATASPIAGSRTSPRFAAADGSRCAFWQWTGTLIQVAAATAAEDVVGACVHGARGLPTAPGSAEAAILARVT